MSKQKVYDQAMAGYGEAIADHEHEYRKASMRNDTDAMASAAMEIAALRVQAKEFDALAREDARGMQASIPKGNKYGLTDEEVEIARSSIVDRPRVTNLSEDDKQKLYAENKQKLAEMRRTGQYSDRA
jgi:hypothetical protein